MSCAKTAEPSVYLVDDAVGRRVVVLGEQAVAGDVRRRALHQPDPRRRRHHAERSIVDRAHADVERELRRRRGPLIGDLVAVDVDVEGEGELIGGGLAAVVPVDQPARVDRRLIELVAGGQVCPGHLS